MHIDEVRYIVNPSHRDMQELIEYERVYETVILVAADEYSFKRLMMYGQSYLLVTGELIKRRHCE